MADVGFFGGLTEEESDQWIGSSVRWANAASVTRPWNGGPKCGAKCSAHRDADGLMAYPFE
jgi:hypothetical protein